MKAFITTTIITTTVTVNTRKMILVYSEEECLTT
jgi:hypothetical protein